MDCCSIANTCVISFVTSLASLCGVVALYIKNHTLENESVKVGKKKNKK